MGATLEFQVLDFQDASKTLAQRPLDQSLSIDDNCNQRGKKRFIWETEILID